MRPDGSQPKVAWIDGDALISTEENDHTTIECAARPDTFR